MQVDKTTKSCFPISGPAGACGKPLSPLPLPEVSAICCLQRRSPESAGTATGTQLLWGWWEAVPARLARLATVQLAVPELRPQTWGNSAALRFSEGGGFALHLQTREKGRAQLQRPKGKASRNVVLSGFCLFWGEGAVKYIGKNYLLYPTRV